MIVEQGLYPRGTRIRFQQHGLPYIGRVVSDDPANGRVKARIETPLGAMYAAALTTAWVDYEHITGRIR